MNRYFPGFCGELYLEKEQNCKTTNAWEKEKEERIISLPDAVIKHSTVMIEPLNAISTIATV
jgi:hypothetical protein